MDQDEGNLLLMITVNIFNYYISYNIIIILYKLWIMEEAIDGTNNAIDRGAGAAR